MACNSYLLALFIKTQKDTYGREDMADLADLMAATLPILGRKEILLTMMSNP